MKLSFRVFRHGWEDNIEIGLAEVGFEGVSYAEVY